MLFSDKSVVHCLFEQSGTFRDVFRAKGFQAYCYDIEDQFRKTDFVIDLFKEIEAAYNGASSLFDKFKADDLLFAFFPCVRFETVIHMAFLGISYNQKNFDDAEKLEDCLQLHSELSYLYSLVTKLCIVCLRRGLRLVLENPYSYDHYLKQYWPLKPSVIDLDRSASGDNFKKPTQYWFINCSPAWNLFVSAPKAEKMFTVDNVRGIARSLINPNYARAFVERHILERDYL